MTTMIEQAMGTRALVRTGGSPGFIAAMGLTVNILVRASDTNGAWSLFDYTMPGGFQGPKPHYHQRMSETFYCISGSVALSVDERAVTLGPGELALVPAGVVHSFANASATEPATMLALLSPGGFERYFEELAELARTSPTWPPADPQAIPSILAKYDNVTV